MAVFIKRCTVDDILSIQECNLYSLPENYQFKYYLYHTVSWAYCSWVAIDNMMIVGYVLTKLYSDS